MLKVVCVRAAYVWLGALRGGSKSWFRKTFSLFITPSAHITHLLVAPTSLLPRRLVSAGTGALFTHGTFHGNRCANAEA